MHYSVKGRPYALLRFPLRWSSVVRNILFELSASSYVSTYDILRYVYLCCSFIVNRLRRIAEVEKKTLCTLFGIKLEEGNKLWSPYTQFVAHVLAL